MTQWIHELRWPQVAEYLKSNDTVLIPVGSTEQHGPHLPLMTDGAQAIDVAQAAAERTGVLITPPLWFGWTPHHMGYPGTIGLRADTLADIVEDIATSLVYHGFKRLILINGHRAANLPPLLIAQARIRNRTNCYLVVVDIQQVARKEIGEICDGDASAIGHACEIETAHMLYTHGEFVDMSKATAQPEKPSSSYTGSFIVSNPYLAGWNAIGTKPTPDEYKKRSWPGGHEGDPTRATKEKGQRIFEAIVANTVEIIEMVKRREVGPLEPVRPPV